jgi:DNA-binding GntR family transcriptional regulator
VKPVDAQPILIDQVYERLVGAITEGSLRPGTRIRQEELALMLGVSRQPVSHALQLLRRQGLIEVSGRRGWTVARIDGGRIRDLYQVRTALDALAARLAAERVAGGRASAAETGALREALERGAALPAEAGVAAYVAADVAFHTAVYRLSGNAAIEETVSAQWLHLKRSMAIVLGTPGQRPQIWSEHAGIAGLVLDGDADGAEAAARSHTDRAASDTVRCLEETAAHAA